MIACLTHSLLITGRAPGIPASTKLTCELGSDPYFVDADEKSLEIELICA